MGTDETVDIKYLRERSIRSTDETPQAWHMETQFELQAVLKASLGPTSIIAELVVDVTDRNDLSLVFSGSNVSVKSHSNLVCSSADSSPPFVTPTLKHDSVLMPTIEGMLSLVSCKTFCSD